MRFVPYGANFFGSKSEIPDSGYIDLQKERAGGAGMDRLKGIEQKDRLPDRNVVLKMERCAEFLARMIEKYGREVLEEIESGEPEEKENKGQ